MSQGLFCSCWAARASSAVVLRGRPPMALAAPQAAAQLKKHFKKIPPGQFLLPPSWGKYWHAPFFAFRQQRANLAQPRRTPFFIHLLSTPPNFFWRFSGIFGISTISRSITSASLEKCNLHPSPSTLNAAGLQAGPTLTAMYIWRQQLCTAGGHCCAAHPSTSRACQQQGIALPHGIAATWPAAVRH